jgi:hypothetical protein
MLRGLHSLIKIDKDGIFHPYHASFVDFLLDPGRSKEFFIDTRRCHKEAIGLAFASLLRNLEVFEQRDLKR